MVALFTIAHISPKGPQALLRRAPSGQILPFARLHQFDLGRRNIAMSPTTPDRVALFRVLGEIA